MRKKAKKQGGFDWKIFLVCLVMVFVVAFFGSLFTSGNVDSNWYVENQPSFNPPSWIFGPVWTILYFLITLSLYFAWTKSDKREKKIVGIVFGLNLIFNAIWSYLFFELQKPLLAFIDLTFIWVTIWAMIFITWKIDRKSAWLLAPYLLWLTFAGILNFAFVV
ncbi:MAG: TspO/MBR family protein [Candidatus Pacearchaeota archaeon]